MLYILQKDDDLWNYMLENISLSYSVTKVRLNRNFFIRACRKILGRHITYLPFLRGKIYMPNMYETLQKIKSNDSVLLLGQILPCEVWAVAKSLPKGCTMYQWYWNPLNREYVEKNIEPNLSFIRSLGYQIYTFDPYDARKYNLHLHNQFGRMLLLGNENRSLKYDFYFLGKQKNRQTVQDEIEKTLNQMGYKNLFIHVTSAIEQIPYVQNIENVIQSKCIIDIVQLGQAGLTLRPLEAMFYRKKILTNNINIQKYDFYQKENIFIWGKDPISRLSSFLSEPYKEINSNIIAHYTIEEWIKEFDKME